MVGLTFRHDSDDHRRAEWRTAGFINPLLILACGNSPLLQQLAEAVAPFAFNDKEVPRLQCAMVRRTHSGTQNVFQLLADGCRFGQAGSATTVNKQFKCVHWLTQRGRRFLLTSGGWVITITQHYRPVATETVIFWLGRIHANPLANYCRFL